MQTLRVMTSKFHCSKHVNMEDRIFSGQYLKASFAFERYTISLVVLVRFHGKA